MEILGIIYQIEIICLLIYSVLLNVTNKNIFQKYILIYMIITNAAELISLLGNSYLDLSTNGIIYNVYSLISLVFFYFFYITSYINKSRIVFSGFSLLAFIYAFFFTSFLKFEYDYKIGIVLSLFYICTALFWLAYKIMNVDSMKITDHPKFYISVGLILWSSFFILRAIPMYAIEKVDNNFQSQLRSIFYLINIIFYFLFLISLIKSKKASFKNEYIA